MNIEQLKLSTRTYNCLRRARIDTVEQLQRMSDADLLRLRNFGARSLAEVREEAGAQKLTNADRIRAMSDDELAMVIACPDGMRDMPCSDSDGKCVDCCLRWLKELADG